MSIQSQMRVFPVYRLSTDQDEYGSKAKTWVEDGTVRAAFNPSPMSDLDTQGLVLREHESVLVTLARNSLEAGKHRVVIDGHNYDVVHIPAVRSRFVRVVVKAVAEGLHELSG